MLPEQLRGEVAGIPPRGGKLRVVVDADVVPWTNGGVSHALLALFRGLGEIHEGIEEYVLAVSSQEAASYWRPLVSEGQTVVMKNPIGSNGAGRTLSQQAGDALRAPLRPLVRYARRRLTERTGWPTVPVSDGFYESLRGDVLHIPWQRFVVASVPTIYNPHDIQHLHYPQFFPATELAWRETMYPTGCRFSRKVVVGSEWAKADFVRHYSLDPSKIHVILEGATTKLVAPVDEGTRRAVRKRYEIPDRFIFYPALTWPHKNHVRLFEALALLRDERGLEVPLVCTGSKHPDFWPEIERSMYAHGLERQVWFLGFVSEADLAALLGSATALVQPSLFEASSLPIFDAWHAGVPVACARSTALPEQVDDAGLLFDPFDIRDMANAVAAIFTDERLAADLRERGFARSAKYSWQAAARAYRALYRQVGGAKLTEEDCWLLAGAQPSPAPVN